MFRYILILVLLVASASPAMAVDTLQVRASDPILEDWGWTVFDKNDGLAGRVFDVYEDGDNIWFGTSGGAQKYDGLRWTTYTVEDGLAHNWVHAVVRAHDGAMWFGTRGGISRLFVSETGEQHWTTYTFDDGSNFVGLRGLCQARDGTIWAGFTETDRLNTGAIRRFSDGKWSIVAPTLDAVRPLPGRLAGWTAPGWGIGGIQAADGAMLFKTLGGVLRFDGTDWTLTPSGLLTDIIEASDGSIWATSYSKPSEVIHFDGHSWIHYLGRRGWNSEPVRMLAGRRRRNLGQRQQSDFTFSRRPVVQLSQVRDGKAVEWEYPWGAGRWGRHVAVGS